MALQVPMTDLIKMADEGAKIKKTAEKIKAKTEAITERVVRTVEVAAGAFMMGTANGYLGKVDPATGLQTEFAPLGIPLSLLTGVGLHAICFAGAAGKMDDHMHAFADGALAAYTVHLGHKVGAMVLTKYPGAGGAPKGSALGGVAGFGALPPGDRPLTDEELAKLAQGVAAR
jgi:hypothetical protein